jgi:hypothetical protein
MDEVWTSHPTAMEPSAGCLANLFIVILLMLLISRLFQSKSTITITIQAGLANLTAVGRATHV